MGQSYRVRRKARQKNTVTSSALKALVETSNLTVTLILNGVPFDPTDKSSDVVIQPQPHVQSPISKRRATTMGTPASLPRSRTNIAAGMLYQHGLGRGNTSVEFSVGTAMKLCGFTETECKNLAIHKRVLRARDLYRKEPPNEIRVPVGPFSPTAMSAITTPSITTTTKNKNDKHEDDSVSVARHSKTGT